MDSSLRCGLRVSDISVGGFVTMGRIRTIKPSFWTDEDLSELPPETHMLAASLLNYSDDEGYFNANPKLVKASCCPLREDSTNVRRGLEQLQKMGYLRLGKSRDDGKSYGHILTFSDHQRVDRGKESKIKVLDIEWEQSTNNRRTIDAGREGKGRERKYYGRKTGQRIFGRFREGVEGIPETCRG